MNVREVVVEIADAKRPAAVLPQLELCAGSVASANGVPFVRESEGDYIYLFPK